MQLETALNAAWLALSVFALASTLRTRLRFANSPYSAPVWLHLCGVALVLAALFPYISATDDILRIQHMDVQQTHERQHPSDNKKSSSDGLMRLYEVMDAPLIAVVQQLAVSTFFLGLVVTQAVSAANRHAPATFGRSPPASAASLRYQFA